MRKSIVVISLTIIFVLLLGCVPARLYEKEVQQAAQEPAPAFEEAEIDKELQSFNDLEALSNELENENLSELEDLVID